MRLSKVLLAYAAASMVAMPVAASAATANPAAKLSLSQSAPVRASSKAGQSKAMGGGFIVAILAVIAIGLGIYAGVDGDSESDSN